MDETDIKDINITTYDIYFIYDTKLKINNKISLDNSLLCETAIEEMLIKFNETLRNQTNIENNISTDPLNYMLYLSNKNGDPKFDYPAIDKEQLLKQTNCIRFCLINTEIIKQLQNPNKSTIVLKNTEKKPNNKLIKAESNTTEIINKDKKICFCFKK